MQATSTAHVYILHPFRNTEQKEWRHRSTFLILSFWCSATVLPSCAASRQHRMSQPTKSSKNKDITDSLRLRNVCIVIAGVTQNKITDWCQLWDWATTVTWAPQVNTFNVVLFSLCKVKPSALRIIPPDHEEKMRNSPKTRNITAHF